MSKSSKGILLVVVMGILVGLGFRALFPNKIEVVSRPRIITQYDTVTVLDTAWIETVREKAETVYTERVVTTPPETVYAFPPALHGVTFLHAGRAIGDSTLVKGFSYRFQDTTLTRSDWQVQFWTGGPVHVLDATVYPPQIGYFTPGTFKSGNECGFWCKLKLLGYGFGTGWVLNEIVDIAK